MLCTLPGLFVTGTDTDVGKTLVTAIIARQLLRKGRSVGIFKPACSGAVERGGRQVWNDVETHYEALQHQVARDRICPQCFVAPLAPPVAAEMEQRSVSTTLIQQGLAWWNRHCELLLLEGAGGLLCPLTTDGSVADLAAECGLPLLIVARGNLGTINHTLLTIEVARQRGLSVAGVLINQISPVCPLEVAKDNADQISRRTEVPVLGVLPYQGDGQLHVGPQLLTLDWQQLARSGS